MIKTHKLDMICLLESKMDVETLTNALKLRFQGMSCIHNLSSPKIRVILLWNNSVAAVNTIAMTDQLIHVKIDCTGTSTAFFATFVYGLHSRTDRKPLWDSLIQLGANLMDPWIVMGDFNAYLSPDDKMGGNPVRNHEITDFYDCVSQLELMDLQSVGCYFAWLKGEVRSKLDRVMVNNSWLLSNVNAFVEYLLPGCISDHASYIISLDNYVVQHNKNFKFFNMWGLFMRNS